jgi:hypothetical protein
MLKKKLPWMIRGETLLGIVVLAIVIFTYVRKCQENRSEQGSIIKIAPANQ